MIYYLLIGLLISYFVIKIEEKREGYNVDDKMALLILYILITLAWPVVILFYILRHYTN